MAEVEPITLEGDGAERAAEILARRGRAVWKHASPGCACGVNMAGEVYVDPICRGSYISEEEVVIQVTIQYPAHDGTHEVAKTTVTLKAKDIDQAKVDMVFMKTAEMAQVALNRYRERRWVSDYQRAAQAKTENSED